MRLHARTYGLRSLVSKIVQGLSNPMMAFQPDSEEKAKAFLLSLPVLYSTSLTSFITSLPGLKRLIQILSSSPGSSRTR
jgi:hypothetical protein